MTAEIAILNKTAIALAADSAVTISVSGKEDKTFDNADKLFELSDHNPIGIMIYNNTSFMETPLQTLIREFRKKALPCNNVAEIATKFLNYLNEFGIASPVSVKRRSIELALKYHFSSLMNAVLERTRHNFHEVTYEQNLVELLDIFIEVVSNLSDAHFIVGRSPPAKGDLEALIDRMVVEEFGDGFKSDMLSKFRHFGNLLIKKQIPSGNSTGLVIAGFGSNEIFPQLLSYEIDGMVFDELKYTPLDVVGVDREGVRAAVLPFAQREMVERFLYGLDQNIERN